MGTVVHFHVVEKIDGQPGFFDATPFADAFGAATYAEWIGRKFAGDDNGVINDVVLCHGEHCEFARRCAQTVVAGAQR